MTNLPFQPRLPALLLGVSILVLAGCNGDTTVNLPKFFDRIGGSSGETAGASVTATSERPAPDARGVITYPTYQVLVSNDGDTFTTMAGRVGLPAEELARHNGLPVGYRARAGEVFALPRNVGGALVGGAAAWNPDIVTTAIDRSTGASGGLPQGTAAPGGVEPQRHQAREGETAYSIARLYNVSVTALASWNGLGPDLAVRPGQLLLIPAASPSSSVAPVAPPVDVTEPGTGTEVPPPPSIDEPLPETESASVAPESPNLEEFRTPDPTRLSAPVSGPIVLPYSPAAGANKNEGIDFGAAAGSPVKAAADGKVVLISEARGGLGTIVLIQHAGKLITIYGRIAGVTVTKGQQVSRGQTIGVVADNDPATLHFEVRNGTTSVDPAPYL